MGEGCSKLKNSKCRSPEPRMSLVCLKNCLEASVLEGGEARVDGDEIRRVERVLRHEALVEGLSLTPHPKFPSISHNTN